MAVSYLSRTFAIAGNNQQVWTYSVWFKRGILGAINPLVGSYNGAGSATQIYLTPSDTIRIYNTGNIDLQTTQVFRDPASWYHLVVAVDCTQATATNRVKVYVNGAQITSFGTSTYPPQNSTTVFDGKNEHTIGTIRNDGSGALLAYFDGAMTEIYFIDGRAVAPTTFGMFDTNNVWCPIDYSGGLYGTNGFYLPFTDKSGLNTLGLDKSGNGNNWLLNGATTNNQSTDVPSNTSATSANFCTFNPLLGAISNVAYSDGNLRATMTGVGDRFNIGTIAARNGKYYWEITVDGFVASNDVGIGIIKQQQGLNSPWVGAGGTNTIFYNTNSGWNIYGVTSNVPAGTIALGDVLGVAMDMVTNVLTIYKNGVVFQALSGQIDLTTPHTLFVDTYSSGSSAVLNCGQFPFLFTPPTGFVSINTVNIGAPAIANGSLHMNAVTYTGNNPNTAPNPVITGFAPDFVWAKSRTQTYNHYLFNLLAGGAVYLQSNNNSTQGSGDCSISFDTDGFSILPSSQAINEAGQGANNMASWSWKAGGQPVTNTQGTISTNVSANNLAGFSIMTYIGTGANATIGHGLGAKPAMVLFKNRSVTNHWVVEHQSLTNGVFGDANTLSLNTGNAYNVCYLNLTNASAIYGMDDKINGSTNVYVAYAWSPVAGYSAFGSYTGNGSTDGPFVYLGFRPRFVMIKNTTAVADWVILDTSRNLYNPVERNLYPNGNFVEGAGNLIDYLSNGFKCRFTYSTSNNSGQTYVYAAFAESPFQYARAR